MSIVCIDIGNTSTQFARHNTQEFVAHKCILTADVTPNNDEMMQYLQSGSVEAVAFCSVVPQAAERLIELIQRAKLPHYRLTWDDCPGLTIQYPEPSEIGEDRLADAIAAQTFYGAPSVVIDMGTAVTFDVVGHSGAYEGGIIAPGLGVMTRYLHEQTALLPSLDPQDMIFSGGIGKSTVEAMKLGCAVGFTGMIQALLKRVLSELAKHGETIPTVIGTGGNAGQLLKELDYSIVIDSDITLKGVYEAWKRKQYEDLS